MEIDYFHQFGVISYIWCWKSSEIGGFHINVRCMRQVAVGKLQKGMLKCNLVQVQSDQNDVHLTNYLSLNRRPPL
jgi:hypothetical protein